MALRELIEKGAEATHTQRRLVGGTKPPERRNGYQRFPIQSHRCHPRTRPMAP